MAYLMYQTVGSRLQSLTPQQYMVPTGGSAAPPANALYLENGRLKSAATPPVGAHLVAIAPASP